MDAVAVGAILFALLLVIAAAMVWQEARSSRSPEEVTYLLDDAVAFVRTNLPAPLASRLDADAIRMLLEWSRYHGQVVVARQGAVPVLGGPEAAAFVASRAAERGLSAADEDVAVVLDLEAAYLVSIGAVGEPVGPDEEVGAG